MKLTIKNLKIMTEEDLKLIEKAPQYFRIHVTERFTTLYPQASSRGKALAVCCDNVWVNVYHVPDEERESFDSLQLRSLMIIGRERVFYWDAKDREDLLRQLDENLDFKRGIFELSTSPFLRSDNIELLPECEKMYVHSKTGDLFCGKPRNELTDGCMGTCILHRGDQDEYPFGDDFRCPMHTYNEEQEAKKVTN